MPPASSPARPSEPNGKRVLVIDDSLTILKVVSRILEINGYGVVTARDGQEGYETLVEQGPFDVVLLDFVMPRMNGYQFCRQLRSNDDHKDVPVVLMSARTSTIGDRFVEQTGAVDALDKPFDARALIAVVGAVLARGKDGVRRGPIPEKMMDEDELSRPESVPPPSRHVRGLDVIAATLSQALAPELGKLGPSDLKKPSAIRKAVASALTEATLGALATAMDMVDISNTNEALRGELSLMPLAEILQLLQLRRQTGLIKVRSGRMSMTLSITEGTLDLAQSSGTEREYRLGRYFVEAGVVSREEMEAAVKACPEGTLLGEYLIEQDKIDPPQLHHALAQQSAELVYEVLRWPEGRFVLVDEPFPPEAEKAQLGLGLSELVLEGFRRVDEWRLMADTIDFDAVLVVDQVALGTLDDSKIGSKERPILEAIDGERTAREVMQKSEVSSFDAIKAIYGLLQARVVREKAKMGKAGANPAHDEDAAERADASDDPKAGKSTPGKSTPAPAAGSIKPNKTKPSGSKFSPTQPSAGSAPGKSSPGKSSLGKSTPGKSTPGKSTPGKSTPGESAASKDESSPS
ncbi:MAG TPA: response regulator [Polyangiaceae bacterium]|nr:response regulator [Polyangiaceae bacterium]